MLTGSELRHTFVRKSFGIDPRIMVLRSFCEGLQGSLRDTVSKKAFDQSAIELRHLDGRTRSEEDFFGPFVAMVPDETCPAFIDRGAINNDIVSRETMELAPDLLVAYGCSIIRSPLLDLFARKFLNVHLGLSPYYRGGGTNFWPLVNGEPEYVGATFMYIDKGVDTGEIIHQIRARIFPHDTPHQIGNRLIGDMARVYIELVARFDEIVSIEQPKIPANVRVYRRKDFSAAATVSLYERFAAGMIDEYLREQTARCAAVPLVEQPILKTTANFS
jgi:methionyl-tRNA formyltransferase